MNNSYASIISFSNHVLSNLGCVKLMAQHNKSMDVKWKQQLCYQTGLLNLNLCGGGFRPRHSRHDRQ